MKVFISWSGELSKKIALQLKRWIPCCIQVAEVFCSSEDIEKGEGWNSKISKELSDTNFGIVCLTSENINAPWVYFEAGALSKQLNSKVSALAIDTKISEIKGPLSSFQATKLEKDDMFRLMLSINHSIENRLTDDVLKTTFEALWEDFDRAMQQILADYEKKKVVHLNQSEEPFDHSDILEEILQLLRSQNTILNEPERIMPPNYFKYLNDYVADNMREKASIIDDYLEELYRFTKMVVINLSDYGFIETYQMFVNHIIRNSPKWKKRFQVLFEDYNQKVFAEVTE